MNETKSVFKTLFEINVNDHVEKKNGLSYLSWPYAWAEVKKRFPDASYKVYETENGCIYFTRPLAKLYKINFEGVISN